MAASDQSEDLSAETRKLLGDRYDDAVKDVVVRASMIQGLAMQGWLTSDSDEAFGLRDEALAELHSRARFWNIFTDRQSRHAAKLLLAEYERWGNLARDHDEKFRRLGELYAS